MHFFAATSPLYLTFKSLLADRDMFSSEAMVWMCQIENDLVTNSNQLQSRCPSHSLGAYVADMQQTTCATLTANDTEKALKVLKRCSEYYHDGTLSAQCWETGCPSVPSECTHKTSVYSILHYIADSEFLDKKTNAENIIYANIVVRLISFDLQRNFYKDKLKSFSSDTIELVGIDDRLKFDIFAVAVIWDMLYLILALGLVTLLALFYLRSFVLVVALYADILFSCVFAYFIYHIVLRFTFFPFMNIMTSLVILSVASSDLFLYFETLNNVKRLKSNVEVEILMTLVIRHAGLSIITTNLTTAVAFFATFITDITMIKCFAIFAGTAIMGNLLLMLTMMPAIISLNEKADRTSKEKQLKKEDEMKKEKEKEAITPIGKMVDKEKMLEKVSKQSWCSCSCDFSGICSRISSGIQQGIDYISKDIILMLVDKLWFIWLILFGGLGIAGAVIIFEIKGWEIPDTKTFQILPEDSPVEVYDRVLKEKFRFNQKIVGLDVYMVWGLSEKDNGHHLDPDDNGTLVYDTSFDLSSQSSQKWMLQFCHDLKASSFISSKASHFDCILDLFNTHMSQRCLTQHDWPCCQQLTAPFTPDIFNECFPKYIQINKDKHVLGSVSFGNVTYKSNVFYYKFESNQEYSTSFKIMNTFYNTLDSFMSNHLSRTLPGVRNGWFSANFAFYDMQRSIVFTAEMSLAITISSATVFMFITTWNLILVFYAMLTLCLDVFFTEGILVLLGWELEVFESIIISLAVGLDFTIHYGISYILSAPTDRRLSTRISIHMVGNAMLMSMLTTFVTGAAMMLAKVYAFKQLGIFLMLIMVNTWGFSTFFFQSLCRIAGPTGFCAVVPCGKSHYNVQNTRASTRHSRNNSVQHSDTSEVTSLQSEAGAEDRT